MRQDVSYGEKSGIYHRPLQQHVRVVHDKGHPRYTCHRALPYATISSTRLDANLASCFIFFKLRRAVKGTAPSSRYIVPSANSAESKQLVQADGREQSTKMHLTKSFKLPQPYILATMLCSFGGFLFGYGTLSFSQLTFSEKT